MKKHFLGFLLVLMINSFSFAQTQLSSWLVNGQKLNFLTPTPTVTTVSGSTTFPDGNNCMYDNAGNMLFFIHQGTLYNKFYNPVASLGSLSMVSEFGIAPSPENVLNPCTKKYFIIINQVVPLVGYMAYGVYDANANSGNGQFTMLSTNLMMVGSPDVAMSISKVRSNGFRNLYLSNTSGNLNVFKISSTGISGVGTYPAYTLSPLGREMELSNNGDKLAYITNTGSIAVVNLTAAGIPTGAAYSFTPASAGQIRGLEFDNSGNYLYYSMSGGNNSVGAGVYVKDLTQPAATVSSSIITGTGSYTGMLEKSYNGTQIICGSSAAVSGINPATATLNGWSAAYDGAHMPDQIDGENYTPALLTVSGPKLICKGGNVWINVQVPASMVFTGYMVEVKDLTTNIINSNAANLNQSFLFTLPQVTTTFQVKLYHPSNPSCNITKNWTVYVLICGIVKVRVDNPPGSARFAATGESEDPALEESQGVQTSWMVQQMDPETNEPVVTIDNPECWRLPISQPVTFKGFNADLDYAADPALFHCDADALDGSFDVEKNYLITRTSWIDPTITDVGGAFIEGGVLVDAPLDKRGTTGINEELNTGKNIFAVYPNPSKGQISIKAMAQQAERVEVYNTIGMKVIDLSAKNNDLSTVDLSALSNGIYTIKIYGGGELQVQKVMMEK